MSKRLFILAIVLVLVGAFLGGCDSASPTEEPAAAPATEPPPTEQPTEIPPTETPTDAPPPTEEPTEEPTSPPTEEADSDEDDSGEAGKALLQERCTVCHSLDRVKNAEKDLTGWQKIISRMLDNGADLTDGEQAILAKYLAENYGP